VSALDRITIHAWKPSLVFCTQFVKLKIFELELGNVPPNFPRKCYVVVAIVVVVVVVVVVVFDIGIREPIIAFGLKWLKILLRDLGQGRNNMRDTDVDYVRKTSNAVLAMIEFKIRVMVLQYGFQFMHCGGIILCVIKGEISDLQAGQCATEYQNMTNVTFAMMLAWSRRWRIFWVMFFLVCFCFNRWNPISAVLRERGLPPCPSEIQWAVRARYEESVPEDHALAVKLIQPTAS
jgi:hypothetical protein